ncbi:MAG: methylmalonyl Co-A mutase-associated GTPase MeaB [Flavisolibacter sp.]
MWQQLLEQVSNGDSKALARSISFVENEQEGYENMLAQLPHSDSSKIIGVTGPPGAGKSSLTDGLIKEMIAEGKKIAVLCVDPSSPFHLGALLGDRIRMSEWYTHPSVFIRSLATRGSMGGLHPKIIEISDLVRAAGYDYIIIETVGVGQSEIEIVGLADTTVVVMVPEGGDEVQTMKAGLMEIADIFVVNKTDRPGADEFVKNLRLMLAPAFSTHRNEIPIVKTIALQNIGISELYAAIKKLQSLQLKNEKRSWLLAERAWQLLQQKRMKGISKQQLAKAIENIPERSFNLYQFVRNLA